MNWLQKTSKVVALQNADEDVKAALNYIANKAKWILWREQTEMRNMPPSKRWFTMTYAGINLDNDDPQSDLDYILDVNVIWSGNDEFYENSRPSRHIDFAAQLFDGRRRSLDPNSDTGHMFHTATEVAQYVKAILDDRDNGDDNLEYEPEPSPTEYAPDPSLVPSLSL